MLDFEKILKSLSNKRPIFHSEADFQHSLAWEIHELYPDCKIRLETKVFGSKTKVYLDILTVHKGITYAIELKYKTRSFNTVVEGEEFFLNNHGAQDIGRYDVLKDLQRLEQMVEARVADKGILIFLTNDGSYYSKSTGKIQTVDSAFRIHEEKIISGQLTWRENTGIGTMKGREEPITLLGNYKMNWKSYSQIDDLGRGQFHYLMLPVLSKQNLKQENLPIEKIVRILPKSEKVEVNPIHHKINSSPIGVRLFSQLGQIPTSQNDFRDKLAQYIKQLGYSVQKNRTLEKDKVDIHAQRDGECIAIEVRYKTALLQTIYNGQHIHLKKQAAQDISRYDYVCDLGKIERLVKNRHGMKGYAILLSNDHLYWNSPKKINSVDEDFHIYEGNVLSGVRTWKEEASLGTTKGREEPICFTGSYKMKWVPYLKMDGAKNGEFKILIVEVTN